MSTSLEDYRLEAYLSGAWVDLSEDVYGDSVNVVSGIPGGQDTDLVARPGRMTFDLYNPLGAYTPGHASAKPGWDLDVKVRLILRYYGSDSTQFVGWVREIKPVFDSSDDKRVKITAYDWLEQAARATISMPQIQRDKTAAQAVQAVLAKSPIQPEATSLATGSTFATVFDTVTGNTTVLGELAKISQSEFGALYLLKDGTLVLESETSRDTGTPFFIPFPYGTEYALLFSDGELFGLQDGDILQLTGIDTLNNVFEKIVIEYGAHYINSGKVTGYPRRVDETPVTLAKTPEPLLIPANTSAVVTLPYVDPTGVARQVAGLTDEMETPMPGSTVDSSLVTAVSFNLDAGDLTGRHAWTLGEAGMMQSDVYDDAYSIQRISGSPPGGGGYVVCGGYSDYKITTPASADFNFGSDAFTIGWWESRIDIITARGSIAYGENAAYPPFLLNHFVPSTRDMLIWMSGNGTSWDVASGRSFGKATASRWRHYELSRDANGWFYAFADGKLTDTWYSPLAMGSSANPLSIGKAQGAYCYAGFADFYIHKGKCLHTKDFEPPKAPKSLYLDEDYWGNMDKYRRGVIGLGCSAVWHAGSEGDSDEWQRERWVHILPAAR